MFLLPIPKGLRMSGSRVALRCSIVRCKTARAPQATALPPNYVTWFSLVYFNPIVEPTWLVFMVWLPHVVYLRRWKRPARWSAAIWRPSPSCLSWIQKQTARMLSSLPNREH